MSIPDPAVAPPAPPTPVKTGRRWRRYLLWLLLILFLGGAGFAFHVWRQLRGSLPALDGEVEVAGLSAPVRLERDAHGVPTVRAQSRDDLMFGLGFLHGQDRFFQMDLLRRMAAGELAELIGAAGGRLVEADRRHRVHRFRARSKEAYGRLTPEEKACLDAYTAGVNAGLSSLSKKPFEYLLLSDEPAPWRPEDSFLVVCAMYLSLQSEVWQKESALAVVDDVYPPAVSRWLGHPGDEWDAPLEGGPLPGPPLPSPQDMDLRVVPPTDGASAAERPKPGSNCWAVAGGRSAVGALLCNDMHLELRLPATWYRACLIWPDVKRPGKERRAVGITLPGGPALAAGSNGDVAWGLTNSHADFADLVLLEDGADRNSYKTPDGPRLYDPHAEIIKVKGQPDVAVTVLDTVWGPLYDGDHMKRQRALRWVAHDAEGMSLRVADLLEARTLEEAMAIANRAGGPHVNFIAADRDGRIGWTILGRIPKRVGFDGRIPKLWSRGACRWAGYWPPDEAPRIVSPADGVLWSANNRPVGGAALAKIGVGDYDRGARAMQIRDSLKALKQANHDDMLKIQLDDRALFLDRWQKKLLAVLTDANLAGNPSRQLYRERVKNWGAQASPDSVGYLLVHGFRASVEAMLLRAVTAKCKARAPDFDPFLLPQPEGVVWRLVSEQPGHLLPQPHQSWDALFLSVIDAQLARLTPDDPDLTKSTWGRANRPHIAHPLAAGLGWFSSWLAAPGDPLPGSPRDMPRVQAPVWGASERFAVSPGKEEQGYFQMPGGQSGHPLSPWFLDGYDAWAKGEKTPLLPGETKHTLTLKPVAAAKRF